MAVKRLDDKRNAEPPANEDMMIIAKNSSESVNRLKKMTRYNDQAIAVTIQPAAKRRIPNRPADANLLLLSFHTA